MKVPVFLTLLSSLMTLMLQAQSYTVVNDGSAVSFKIKNLGFTVNGSFSGLQGTIEFDPRNNAADRFDVSVDANTVFTDNSMRDNHLRDEDYFDVQNHPHIRFVSTAISGREGHWTITGNLTIKGVTKSISFPFSATSQADGWLFQGAFPLKRRDFGIGGRSTISDDLTVQLSVIARKA